MRLVVIGGGTQGRLIAGCLQERKEKPEVLLADSHEPAALPPGVQFQQLNVGQQEQAQAVARDADALVLAVPDAISEEALANLIATGKPVADVCSRTEPALALGADARKSGSCCVVDLGLAPSLSHILVGSAVSEFGHLDSVRIFVGDVPENPPAVFRHAVYVDPQLLFSAYVQPARARKSGKEIAAAPLEHPPERYIDSELGQLDAVLSDGLRSLLTSYPDISDMSAWTLRWNGHLDAVKTLSKIGLFDDASSASSIVETLANRYSAADNPALFLLVVEARRKHELRFWRLLVRSAAGVSAMDRLSGLTAAAVAMILARKQFVEPGVHPPERLGSNNQLIKELVQDLSDQGVNVSDKTLAART